MHDVIDTEAEDLAAESYWPGDHKQVLRKRLQDCVLREAGRHSVSREFFQKRRGGSLSFHDDSLNFLGHAITIGAENGSDQALARMSIFLRAGGDFTSAAIPFSSYLWPTLFPPEVQNEIREEALAAFSREHLLEHFYEDHYRGTYPSFRDFVNAIAEKLLTGAVNGADEMLRLILTALELGLPLPPVRRFAKLLKRW